MRAVIAEDSVLLRVGLVKVLETAGFDVAAAVGDAEALLAAVQEHRPDLALVDVRMPPSFTDEGVRAALVIRRQFAATAVVLLSQYVGGTALDPEVVAQLLLRRNLDPLRRLTARERDVLALMAEGRSNAGIAEVLVVSDSAVAKHINNIFAKLDLPPADGDHRRVLAVLRFLGGAAGASPPAELVPPGKDRTQ